MKKVKDIVCPYEQRYYNLEHDACRMCELRDDCPLDPDNFDPSIDCPEDEYRY